MKDSRWSSKQSKCWAGNGEVVLVLPTWVGDKSGAVGITSSLVFSLPYGGHFIQHYNRNSQGKEVCLIAGLPDILEALEEPLGEAMPLFLSGKNRTLFKKIFFSSSWDKRKKKSVEGCAIEEICVMRHTNCIIWGRLTLQLYLLLQEIFSKHFKVCIVGSETRIF